MERTILKKSLELREIWIIIGGVDITSDPSVVLMVEIKLLGSKRRIGLTTRPSWRWEFDGKMGVRINEIIWLPLLARIQRNDNLFLVSGRTHRWRAARSGFPWSNKRATPASHGKEKCNPQTSTGFPYKYNSYLNPWPWTLCAGTCACQGCRFGGNNLEDEAEGRHD